MNKKVLITGVAGMIGANLADWIIKNHPEYEVVGIDNLFGGYMENVNPKVDFHKIDLSLEPEKVNELFNQHKFEYVFHLACYAAEGLSPFIRRFNYDNNIGATVNIINNCITHDVKRLIYTSSMSVYGRGINEGVEFNEDDRPAPIDPYAISKYACEMDIKVAGEQHGLDWCIIRPHNVYGIKQNIWDKYRNVLGIWMYQILNDKPMLIYGDGEQTRAFSYVDDCMESFWNAATFESASKQIVNVGGLKGISINEAAKVLCEITGYNNIEHKEARHEVKHAVPDGSKAVELLKFKEKTTLYSGLNNMWEWAKVQPMRPQYKWPSYEIEKGLYSYWK